MKRQNGGGTIRKMPGNRRKPYGAYPPRKYDKNGAQLPNKAIGYYETEEDAKNALEEHLREAVFLSELKKQDCVH